ncbi:MAG TPA: DUF1573 domain-containing protein [Bacteroidales bacterium]
MFFLYLVSATAFSQNDEFPVKIGNIGFAVDSLDIVIGNVSPGQKITHNIEMHNFGRDAVVFRAGKSSPYLDVLYEPSVLQPGQSGTAIVNFDVIKELPFGPIAAEISIESDDKLNPYKFLYLLGNIIEDTMRNSKRIVLDTVPRLIFDQYNYYFGHLSRGKKIVHTFFFTNMGSQMLVIDDIIPSEGCEILKLPEEVVEPGGYGSLVVKVTTVGDFGVQHRTINISSNDPIHPLITLGIHGTVRQHSPSNQNPSFCYE